jgi:glycosyltransferase involved in cell wall biosynthesis
MAAIAELFETTTIIVPLVPNSNRTGDAPLAGDGVVIRAVPTPPGQGLGRKLLFPFWVLRHSPLLIREAWRTDAIHTPIPGDIGTIGMLLALAFRKPLFVRYCGNWTNPRTVAERFWIWYMEQIAGGKNVMYATGGALALPSRRNQNIEWIFSTSLTASEIKNIGQVRSIPTNGHARLAIVCRQEGGKGTDVVINALRLLVDDFPGITLAVGGDGTSLQEYKTLATELGVASRVTFHGRLDHGAVLQLLGAADLFCFPSSSEGFPKVVHEALSCGLPVISTRVSVLSSLISSECGRLLEEATGEALASAVRECLSDSEGYENMSRKALDIAKGYSLERWRDMIGFRLKSAWKTNLR